MPRSRPRTRPSWISSRTSPTSRTSSTGRSPSPPTASWSAHRRPASNSLYARTGSFWAAAPSNPTPAGLFSSSATYARPAAAYIALWQILGTDRFTQVLRHIQHARGGGSITEPQLEAAFRSGLPDKTKACRTELGQFFTEWFDTAYPTPSGAAKPDITGPGLAGPGFYRTTGGECKNA